jgi:hypothetical protein
MLDLHQHVRGSSSLLQSPPIGNPSANGVECYTSGKYYKTQTNKMPLARAVSSKWAASSTSIHSVAFFCCSLYDILSNDPLKEKDFETSTYSLCTFSRLQYPRPFMSNSDLPGGDVIIGIVPSKRASDHNLSFPLCPPTSGFIMLAKLAITGEPAIEAGLICSHIEFNILRGWTSIATRCIILTQKPAVTPA